MSIPTQRAIRDALLRYLALKKDPIRPKDAYGDLAAYFPGMTEAERHEKVESGENLFNNRVRFARNQLREEGLLDSSVRGRWSLTEHGFAEATKLSASIEHEKSVDSTSPSFSRDDKLVSSGKHSNDTDDSSPRSGRDSSGEMSSLPNLVKRHEMEVKDELKSLLAGLPAEKFEKLAARLLDAMGFCEMTVTNKGADGGVDGYGELEMGVVRVKAAFQCKRWSNVVGRPEVDAFRGAIQGKYDYGIFMATSSFTARAEEESMRSGCVPIIMVDGSKIIDLMVQREVGVWREPLSILKIDDTFFLDPEDE